MIQLKPHARLVIASHNQGKVGEIAHLLASFAVEVVGAGELGLAEPDETGTTFAANAALKAEAATKASGLAALADDSGLCVDVLDGKPGVHSARWAGPDRDFPAAMQRIEDEVAKTDDHDHRAHFVCALALAAPGATTEIVEGRVFGTLAFPPRGTHGFGYDPIFLPEASRFTFGEMKPSDKHVISHRARAFEKLIASGAFPRA